MLAIRTLRTRRPGSKGSRLAAGFSLVELMIGIAIIALLLAMGLPSISSWLMNSQIRNSAETVQNGLQLARAEAVRRNTRVEFVLVSVPGILTNITTTPSTTGLNWLIRLYQTGGVYTAADFIQGSGDPNNAQTQVVAGDATVVFNGLGRTDLTAINSIQFSNPGYACVAAGGPARCLNVVVQLGGQIRMCDPSVTAASGDTRAC